jgi:c-di-AMP phosphodiesterase-like protein
MNELLFQTSEEEAAAAEEDLDGEYDIQDGGASKSNKECIVTIGKRLYHAHCHAIGSTGRPYYILTFTDVNDLKELTELHRRELTAVGYIVLDNIDDIAQYVKENFESETTQVDRVLRDWASSNNAVLRAYDKNKYVILMNREMLEKCVERKFDVLNSIADVHIGESGMPIMASIGIATTGSTLAQRERDAMIALDMALQRGGGQVVLKTEKGNEYFGGRQKSQQKRTGMQSRIIANHLCSTISGASTLSLWDTAIPTSTLSARVSVSRHFVCI